MRAKLPLFHALLEKTASKVIAPIDVDAGNALLARGTQEGVNRPNIRLQEKFHRAVLRGLRNVSETP